MKLETWRCPNCHAPLDDFRGRHATCRYCGGTITTDQPPAHTEARFWLVLRVGPSNLERILPLVCERLGAEVAEARSRLAEPPWEIAFGTDQSAARLLARDLVRAGAQADVVERVVEVPLVGVLLEDVGKDRVATIATIRRFVDLGRQQARELVERMPVVVVEAIPETRALELVEALQKAGARARLS